MIRSNESIDLSSNVRTGLMFNESARVVIDNSIFDVYKYSSLKGALQHETQKRTFDLIEIESRYFPPRVFACSHLRKDISEKSRSILLVVYNNSMVGADAEALKVLYFAIEGAFAEGDLKLVDNLLEDFDPGKVKKIIAVGILRSTFRARSELRSWESCLAKVACVLTENNQPAAHLLRGLYNNNGKPLLAKKHAV